MMKKYERLKQTQCLVSNIQLLMTSIYLANSLLISFLLKAGREAELPASTEIPLCLIEYCPLVVEERRT